MVLATTLAAIDLIRSDLAAALAEATHAHKLALTGGDGFVADASQALIGLVHFMREDHAEATENLNGELSGLLRRGDRGMASTVLCWLSLAAMRASDLGRAGQPPHRRTLGCSRVVGQVGEGSEGAAFHHPQLDVANES